MAGFKLTKGADTFDFDVFGAVKDKDGKAVGTWETDKNNKIALKKDAGGSPLLFDVVWKFNSNNQLGINVDDKEVFNFHKVGNRPFYATRDAVLKVRPDQNNIFGFDLRGEWDLSDKHDLSITINGVVSVLDGFIQDTRSRFMYHFFDKGTSDLTQRSILGFIGEWVHKNEAGAPMLDFKYKREDKTEDIFSLPKALSIDRRPTSLNQFMYEYDKKGQKSRIQFVGTLKVSEDFVITYELDRQVAQTGEQQVAATTFTIKAEIDKKDFSGNIDFRVKKEDGTSGTTTLTLRGNFTAMLGKTKLQIGFSFDQVRSTGTVTTTFAFNGSLELKNGKVQWSFEKSATKTTLVISATDIVLGPARVDARLNLVRENGQISGVQVLLGVSF